jgi:hypothetical protein
LKIVLPGILISAGAALAAADLVPSAIAPDGTAHQRLDLPSRCDWTDSGTGISKTSF